MNAYLIDGLSPVSMLVEYIAGEARYEEVHPFEVYVAETRGKARAMFCSDYDFEWTEPISIRLIAKNVDLPAGTVVNDSPLWARVGEVLGWGDDLDE